jgi:cysteinyl-tRNA synthetase
VVIMDLFVQDDAFTATEIEQLHHKANGGRRMLVCYMSIGEAEDYRYYWNDSWSGNPPSWMAAENPEWPGNYKVQYWNSDWQDIIYKKTGSYLDKIVTAGFDGVYLDIIDAFEYFEG